MKKFLATILIILCALSSFGATRYVSTTGAGTRSGNSWANAGPTVGMTPLAWVNSVMAGGDTMYFAPGTYIGEVRPPTNTNSIDRTCYSASDGITVNYMYDPGVVSLGGSPTRDQFEQSLLVSKACTLTSATKIPKGTTWTNYSGNIWSAPVTLLPFRFWPTDRAYCGGQDTTQFDARADLASLTAPGRMFHDITNGRVYVWCYGSDDPTLYDIWVSSSCTIDFDDLDNSNYVTIYGFDIRWAYYAGVHLSASGVDSVFVDHCRITKIGTQQASNAGIVGCQTIMMNVDCGGSYDCTYPYDGKHNRIRACYGAQIYEPGLDAGRCKLVTTYAQSHMVVESCLAVGIGGVDWKNQAAGGSSYGNTFKYNTVKYWPTTAYENLCGHNQQDSCYGNYFIGDPTNNDMKAVWFEFSALAGNTQAGSGHFVANNTIYQAQNALASGIYDDHDAPPNWIKYNIFNGGGMAQYVQMHYGFSNDTSFLSDSNLVYGFGTNCFNRNAVSMSLTTWRTYRSGLWADSYPSSQPYHDLYTVTYNPGFNNPANNDFSRPLSTQEMNLFYGGKQWSRLGAWQPGDTVLTVSDAQNYEGDTITFYATISAARASTVTFNYATSNGTAIAGTDYTSTSGSGSITPGLLSYTIKVPTTENLIVNSDKTFILTLSNISGVKVSDSIATGTIVDDEASIYVSDKTGIEGPTFEFIVSLSKILATSVTYDFTTVNGTAIAGVDYTTISGTYTIPAGVLRDTISVVTINNAIDEPDRQFTVVLSNPVHAEILDGTGLGTILDNDDAPSTPGETTWYSITRPVTVSSDDIKIYGTAGWEITSVEAPVGYTGTYSCDYGARFRTINIPSNAIVDTAYLKLRAYNTTTSAQIPGIFTRIYCEKAIQTSTFTGRATYDSRVKTTAYTDWSPPAITAGLWYSTPNFKTSVQEWINMDGHIANDSIAIVVFIKDYGSTGTGYRRFNQFDAGAAYAETLHIAYYITNPSTNTPKKKKSINIFGEHNEKINYYNFACIDVQRRKR